MRQETIALRKAEAGYIAPHEQKVCARCLHFKTRGDRPQGYCQSLKIDVAGKGVCTQFTRARMIDGIRRPAVARGIKYHSTKLDEVKVARIIELLRNDVRGDTLADMFGVSSVAISDIKHGRTWRHVPRFDA